MSEEDRNIGKVIDDILEIAPDLTPNFRSLTSSIRYSPPELINHLWIEAASILNSCALDHPKRDEISKIFGGE